MPHTHPPDPTPAELMEVLGALAFALADSLTDVQRSRFAHRLDGLAAYAGRERKPVVMGALRQIHAAVRGAP